ncbi:VOC family protein [Halocatena marina]|uniref:VOC family protein n=1 Tax=Halocatena marina TaxID=2934937 RepID=A0ABD5YIE3_9EURY|nr:VOC family protein [Halocatena marina]
MNVQAIDHVNLRIPEDRIDDAIEFYSVILGFEMENRVLFESGEKSFFSFRLTDTSVVHVRPVDNFKQPNGHSYDHVALLVSESVKDVKRQLINAGVEIERELEPLGATGVAPAVYVKDPFGYLIEIKETN